MLLWPKNIVFSKLGLRYRTIQCCVLVILGFQLFIILLICYGQGIINTFIPSLITWTLVVIAYILAIFIFLWLIFFLLLYASGIKKFKTDIFFLQKNGLCKQRVFFFMKDVSRELMYIDIQLKMSFAVYRQQLYI